MSTITDKLSAVRARIQAATTACGRPDGSCELIAVSKTKPATAIEDAASDGQRHFGENYLREALDKQQTLSHLPLVWHFIGAIQSNKTRDIANHFDWVHTIDRKKIATRLSAQRPPDLEPLNLLIQVNLQNEAGKAGIHPDELISLAEAIDELESVRLRGLMAIPKPSQDAAEQLAVFRQLADLNVVLAERFDHIDTLSMGMTDDMEAAIEAGATFVRIGTAVFGPRD